MQPLSLIAQGLLIYDAAGKRLYERELEADVALDVIALAELEGGCSGCSHQSRAGGWGGRSHQSRAGGGSGCSHQSDPKLALGSGTPGLSSSRRDCRGTVDNITYRALYRPLA